MITLEMVREFHEVFKLPIYQYPYIEDTQQNELRIRLLREEVAELETALKENNPVEVIDALSDIQYILDGTYLALGFHEIKIKGVRVAHESNMKKLDENGQPIIRADGKILKPDGWVPPDFKKLIGEWIEGSY